MRHEKHETRRLSRRGIRLIVAACGMAMVAGSVDLLARHRNQPAGADIAAVQRVLDDYIGLYRRDRLEAWKALFVPGFTATYTNDDGSVTSRSLEEFYERQRAAFERGPVSETLENVRIHRSGRLAHVFADFTFTSGNTTRPGQLMLLMIAVKGELKIAALTFTYHLEPKSPKLAHNLVERAPVALSFAATWPPT